MSDRRRSSRWPLLGLVIAVVAVATLALTGAAKQVPGLEFLQTGHWIANPDLGLVVHVDGATKRSDAQVTVPGVKPGNQVLQNETHGYVVGDGEATVFGKSTLSVETTVPLPTGERPVGIEVAGGPYSIFLEAGQVVRWGPDLAPMSVGGRLGPPVATNDGTLWLHRLDNGAICRISRGSTSVVCQPMAPAGHSGGLTVSGDRAMFLDTTDDTISTIEANGLGAAMKLGVDVPPNAKIAPADAAGRVAVLDPATNRMHLVDGRPDGKDREPAETVQLPAGNYDGPTVTGESVVLLDQSKSNVHTYDPRGRERGITAVPTEKGKPTLTRGEDARVYVDGGEGKHVMVVDKDGSAKPVPVVAAKPDQPRQPVPPPAEKPADKPVQPPVANNPPRDTGRPVPPPVRTTTPKAPPPIPVTPPGMPPNLAVAITTKQVDATVTWGNAPANGAPVTAYHVSWRRADGVSGAERVTGNSFVIRGIWSGNDQAFSTTVVAENSAGLGTPATVQTTPPPSRKSISLTKGPLATEECGRPKCYWMHVVMTGFEPETKYNVYPHSTAAGYSNPGHGAWTNSRGSVEFNAFYYHGAGHEVWVETDGVTSNRLLWTE